MSALSTLAEKDRPDLAAPSVSHPDLCDAARSARELSALTSRIVIDACAGRDVTADIALACAICTEIRNDLEVAST